jgi:hypothetical protein
MAMTIDGSTGLVFPAGGAGNPSSGNLVSTTDTQTLTNKTLTSPTITGAVVSSMASSTLTFASVQAASGNVVDFTGIPSWVKQVTVMFSSVSGSGTSAPLVQIGAGSVEATGYAAAGMAASPTVTIAVYTTGFGVKSAAATDVLSGSMTLNNITGNTWVASYSIVNSAGTGTFFGGDGTKTLTGGVLDRVRVTFVNGTDVFDAGNLNIMYS